MKNLFAWINAVCLMVILWIAGSWFQQWRNVFLGNDFIRQGNELMELGDQENGGALMSQGNVLVKKGSIKPLDFEAKLVGLVVAAVFPLLVYYTIYGLASANILCTIVQEGWCKIVLTWGKNPRILKPGLRWIGLPGINTLYKRTMTFLKSVTDESGQPKAEPHPDPKNPQKDTDISSFKTTDYAYAFPFKDEEDRNSLNLSGMLAVVAVIEDYEKAFFSASDWYSSMNTAIMPRFRYVLTETSYDVDLVGGDKEGEKEKKQEEFSIRFWDDLNSPREEDPKKRSTIQMLREDYGVWIKSVELRSVDPPLGWRDTTLAPYKAKKEREAALHEAAASAARFDDTNQALKAWIQEQSKGGNKPTREQISAKQEELRQRALAKTSGYQQIHIKGLENATTAVIGGSGAGILLGGQQGGGSGKGKKGSSGGGKPKKSPEAEDEDDDDPDEGWAIK